jgi:hypothetical protein
VNLKRLVDHPLYACWADMNQRCYNPNTQLYKYYGERGIKVCERWKRKKRKDSESFFAFVQDMGDRPKNYTLERINVNGDYEPTNCKWASKSEQVKNRRKYKNPKISGEYNHNSKITKEQVIEISEKLKGLKHGLISELAREYKVNRSTIYRIQKGEMYYST